MKEFDARQIALAALNEVALRLEREFFDGLRSNMDALQQNIDARQYYTQLNQRDMLNARNADTQAMNDDE